MVRPFYLIRLSIVRRLAMRVFYALISVLLVVFALCLFYRNSQWLIFKRSQNPSQWEIPSKKIIQRIEEERTKDLRERINPKANFSDFFAGPSAQVISMGPEKEQILVVTLEAFKTQDGADISVYRLDGGEPRLIQEFDCKTKEGYEILPINGDNALLIHDEEKKDGDGCLYLFRKEKLKKVFEFPDTDYEFQNGFTFQTKLGVKDQKLYLYRWDSPGGQRTTDDLKENTPSRIAVFDWDDSLESFVQETSKP